MLRILAGGAAVLLLGLAGFFFWQTMAVSGEPLPAAPPSTPYLVAPAKLPEPPAASERTREEKRFDRYDKDRDQRVTREEYLASRRKAWARLDTDGDGKLSFEEWSAKTLTKFSGADTDRSGVLDRSEFSATRATRKSTPRYDCPAAAKNDEG